MKMPFVNNKPIRLIELFGGIGSQAMALSRLGVNSNTQLYKQAGNSIVVDVLVAIFDNLLIHSRSAWLDELLKDMTRDKGVLRDKARLTG